MARSSSPLRVVFAVLLVSATQTGAATFTVDAPFDAVDAIPGDGACATTGGACTLRAAVLEANALAGMDVINLPAGTYLLTLPLPDPFLTGSPQDGDLDVADDLDIVGAGAAGTIIDAGCTGFNEDRAIEVTSGVTARLFGVTVRGGCPFADGGGIYNAGTLELTDCAVTQNDAAVVLLSLGQRGGGIYSSGSVTLRRCAVTDNQAFAGRNAQSLGGGIASAGTLVIEDSTISGNAANLAGGINSTGIGGIVNTTISGNVAYAAPIYFGPPPTPPAGTCGSHGGGVLASSTIFLANSTVASNTADPGTLVIGGFCSPGDGAGVSGTITVLNTIIDNDSPVGDCSGTITSQGHNIAGDMTCALGGSGDQNGVDPMLGPLQDNGGPTETHAPLTGSPAIDAGDDTACPPNDQRGVPRPQGTACDVGAVEVFQGCLAAPQPLCRAPVEPVRAQLVFVNGSTPSRDAASFKWRKGAETDANAFGDPLTTETYSLCVYGAGGLVFAAEAPVGGTCGTAPCWTALGGGGFRYRDRTKSTDGLASILLKPGSAGRARVLVSAKGLTLRPLPPLPLVLPVTAQVQASNGECWSADFGPAGVLQNDGLRFKGNGVP